MAFSISIRYSKTTFCYVQHKIAHCNNQFDSDHYKLLKEKKKYETQIRHNVKFRKFLRLN